MGGTLSTLYDPLEEAEEVPEHVALGGSGSGVATNTGNTSPDPRLINYADLVINPRPIGSGSFATVYSAKWNGIDVAVKKFRVGDNGEPANAMLCGSMAASWVRKEVRLLEKLNCDRIVTYCGICQNPPCIVTELCHRGSLLKVLKTAKSNPMGSMAAALSWKQRLQMALDIAVGMAYLHSKNILHRDLKSPNLFVTREYRIKIGDLGLGKLVDEGASVQSATIGEGMAVIWMAPERFNIVSTDPSASQLTRQAEVYSFGVVMWELMTWQLPWAGKSGNQIACIRGGGKELQAPDWSLVAAAPESSSSWPCYKDVHSLINICLSKEPSERPTFHNVVELLTCYLETLTAPPREMREVHQPQTQGPPQAVPAPLRPPSPLPHQLTHASSVDLGLVIECTEALKKLINAFTMHKKKTQQVAEEGLLSAVVDVLNKISASIPAGSRLHRLRTDLIEYNKRAQNKLQTLRAGYQTGWSDADANIIRDVAERAYSDLKKILLQFK